LPSPVPSNKNTFPSPPSVATSRNPNYVARHQHPGTLTLALIPFSNSAHSTRRIRDAETAELAAPSDGLDGVPASALVLPGGGGGRRRSSLSDAAPPAVLLLTSGGDDDDGAVASPVPKLNLSGVAVG